MTPIEAAETWLGTPYHHRARVPGVGVDCLMLIADAYQQAGLVPADLEIPEYPSDIMFHTDDDRYLQAILAYCDEVAEPRPNGLAMFRFGRTYSHSAIIVDWPVVIHAYANLRQVIKMPVTDDMRLARRPVRFFYPKGLA